MTPRGTRSKAERLVLPQGHNGSATVDLGEADVDMVNPFKVKQ